MLTFRKLIGLLVIASTLLVNAMPTHASTFPGANGKLTFSRNVAAGTRHIFSINSDGSGLRDLTPTGPEIVNDRSSISPDGGKVVFISNRDFAPFSGQDIYVMNIDGSGVLRLTNTTVNQFPDQPTWSADARKIAFVRGSQIWTMNADGTAQAQLTSDLTSHEAPSWSPNGLSIAFARRFQPGDTGSRIYVMNSDGTGARPISSNSGVDGGNISWSPDGALVGFESTRNGGGEIWVAAADGSGEKPDALVRCCRGVAVETPGGGNAAWSPDGSHLAFESNGLGSDPEFPRHSIFVVDSAGSGLTRLTHGDGDSAVNWGPAPAVKVDSIPPLTSATLSGSSGANGWWVGPVTITLSAEDNPGGSGVGSTSYVLDGGLAQMYSGPFRVTGDGAHQVSFHSTDRAGNVEADKTTGFKIDQTEPTTTAQLTGPSGTNGWYTGAVTVTLSALDNLSGVASTTFSLDGGPAQAYTQPFTLTADGPHTVNFNSSDVAGNVESARAVNIKVDQTPPTTMLMAGPGTLAPFSQLVTVSGRATVRQLDGTTIGTIAIQCWNTPGLSINLKAVDNVGGSGVVSLAYAASGAQPIAATQVNGDAVQLSITAPGVTTLSWVAATDAAGNVAKLSGVETMVVGTAQGGLGLACASGPDTVALPLHGTLGLTGVATSGSMVVPFSTEIRF